MLPSIPLKNTCLMCSLLKLSRNLRSLNTSRKRKAIKCILLNHFTTMRAIIWPYVLCNGQYSGRGTHLSVSMLVKDGRYDDDLSWPYHGKIYITLLNQLEDKKHYTRTIMFHGLYQEDWQSLFPSQIWVITLRSAHSISKTTDYDLKYV